MDVQEFLESGKLELYVLGALSEEESKSVLKLTHTHPKIKEEFIQLETCINNLCMEAAVPPRQQLSDKILTTIDQYAIPGKPAIDSKDNVSKETVNTWKWLSLAFFCAFVFSLVLYLYDYEQVKQFHNHSQALSTTLETIKAEKQKLHAELDSIKNSSNSSQSVDSLFNGILTYTTVLTNKIDSVEDKLVVRHRDDTDMLLIDVYELPSVTSNFEFVLWLQNKDSSYLNLGPIHKAERSLIKHTSSTVYSGFLVTLEMKPTDKKLRPTVDQQLFYADKSDRFSK